MSKLSPKGMLRICAAAALATPGFAHADVFISEYIEGSSNNKAIEIYNGGDAAVDLAGYKLEYYFNGSSTVGTTIALSGTVAAGDVFVVANGLAVAEVLAAADLVNSASWYNGDDAVVLKNGTTVVDSVGQQGVDPGSAWGVAPISTANNSIRRLSTICTGDVTPGDAFDPAVEWEGFAQDTFSGLGSHTVTECGGVIDPPDSESKFIHEVQGSASASPLVGSLVTIQGVVTADFQGTGSFSGFYVQEEDADADTDASTSEGIFVYSTATDVNVGDLVTVTATVAEYYNLTELTGATITVVSSGNPLPAITDISLPLTATDTLEAFEGMRVRLPQTLTVTEHYNMARYGEVWLATDRLMQPTNVAAPGAEALAVQAANDLSRILIDDGSSVQNPDPVVYPAPGLSAFNTLRVGDSVAGVVGVLDYSFSTYRVQPTEVPSFVASNPRATAPDVAGELRVASFNVLNYFNGDGVGGGFPTSRGADTAEEFARQRAKIVAAITSMDADIIGLMEIENDGYAATSAIQDLVNGLNAAAPAGTTYAFINPGVSVIGTDEIAVGLIYRSETVAPLGNAALLTSAVDPRFVDTLNRPALAQSFTETATGAALTVVVNHLKSKGSDCADVADPDTGDGQGNCNITRTNAALALVDWLATDPTGAGDTDFLVIGDMNAYAKEDPITAFVNGGFIDSIDAFIGSDAGYSYVFDGQSGYLDHALASADLFAQIAGVTEWHINADEPRALDYNVEFKSTGQVSSFYNDDAYRSSDHDPVVVGLNLVPPAPVSVSVSDLDGVATVNGRVWQATVSVVVTDNQGAPVSGAVVSGSWTGGINSGVSASCVTAANGSCSVSYGLSAKRTSSASFAVSGVVAALPYDAAANSDVDGDSNGTTIVVSQ